ncbi:MAG: hypothetical protein ABII71_05360 [Candidatus Micrarchaeota archaeon]
MAKFNQEEFNSFILENGVIGFFKEPIKLKSGRMSNWYVNWRTPTGDVFLLDKLTDFVLAFAEDNNLAPDCFYGVPEGATKLGLITQYKYARNSPNYSKGSHVLPMGRAKPKEHGAPKDRFFVGQPEGRVIVLEDVTTTGGSLLCTISQLREAGIEVAVAISLTNRMEMRDDNKSVKQALGEKGVRYLAMSSALDLLPASYAKLNPGEEVASGIEAEFGKYGVEALKLR